jgi:uncharacterized protein with HEPN domain
MLDSIEKIKQYCASFSSADEFYNATQAFDASLMNFIILGEMVERLSEELINSTDSEINWFKIKGFRNVLAHDYFGFDAEEVWQIIHNNLPEFESQLKKLTM